MPVTTAGTASAQCLVEALRRQHANLETVLAAFERQVSRFEAGESPDYELAERLIGFCIDELNADHRVLEAPLLEALYHRRIIDGDTAAQYEAEYGEIVRAARGLAAAIQDVIHEAEIRRDTLVRMARAFLASCRRHIGIEEQRFFPAAIAALGNDDWRRIGRTALAVACDLPDAAYRRRYERLVAWDQADRREAG